MCKEEKDFLENLQKYVIEWDIEKDKKPKAKMKSDKDVKFVEDQDLDSFKMIDFNKNAKSDNSSDKESI